MDMTKSKTAFRQWIVRGLSAVEDIVYIGLGLLLACVAILLLINAAGNFVQSLRDGSLQKDIIDILDRILLIMLVVELLYTVQVSFREHAVIPEPFLLVGLIAAIRRVLVLTAEFGHAGAKGETVATYFMVELGVLTLLIVSLAVSIFVLRKRVGPGRMED